MHFHHSVGVAIALGLSSALAQAGDVDLQFPLELWREATAPAELQVGDRVTVDYERMRFKEIVDRKLQAERNPNSS